MSAAIEVKNEWRCFGGRLVQFSHSSAATGTPMRCTVFLPPSENVRRRWGGDRSPVVYYLSGLTCTDENFTQKAGAQRVAAELGIALVAPDTSPRGAGVEGEDDSWGAQIAAMCFSVFVDWTCVVMHVCALGLRNSVWEEQTSGLALDSTSTRRRRRGPPTTAVRGYYSVVAFCCMCCDASLCICAFCVEQCTTTSSTSCPR